MKTTTSKTLEDFIEKAADIEHARWSHWQSWVHQNCIKGTNGSLIITPKNVERWEKQINTQYKNLSEMEKEADRAEVRSYIPLIKELLVSQRGSIRGEIQDIIAGNIENSMFTPHERFAANSVLEEVLKLPSLTEDKEEVPYLAIGNDEMGKSIL